MTQLTHAQARELIQQKADKTLLAEQRKLLDAHLLECSECIAYASELSELEAILRRVMQSRWNLAPAPLSIGLVSNQAKGKSRKIGNMVNLVPTRIIAMALALIVTVIGLWQISLSSLAISPNLPTSAPPVPTPSIQQTVTHILFQGCSFVSYQVQKNDTLESIAHQFSVTEEDIMKLNNMETEVVKLSMELKIPLCNFTPTGTTNVPTNTITITPQIEAITYTPG